MYIQTSCPLRHTGLMLRPDRSLILRAAVILVIVDTLVVTRKSCLLLYCVRMASPRFHLVPFLQHQRPPLPVSSRPDVLTKPTCDPAFLKASMKTHMSLASDRALTAKQRQARSSRPSHRRHRPTLRCLTLHRPRCLNRYPPPWKLHLRSLRS